MVQSNITVFRADQVDSFQFGNTALPEGALTSTALSLATSFAANNNTILLDLVGDPTLGASNPGTAAPFAKDISVTGNERSTSEEPLLGVDSVGSQNQEVSVNSPSKLDVEATLVYRNPVPLSIFNSSTKSCMIEMDNSETGCTGKLTLLFNNIKMSQVGNITRNADGLMEQKIKFSCRGGTSNTAISVTEGSDTFYRIRAGRDYAEEIQTGA